VENIEIFAIEDFENLKIETDEQTTIISMNKDVNDDVMVLEKFIKISNLFLGVYGSKEKGQNLKKILLSDRPFLSREISKIKIPLGLDIDV